MSKEINKKNKEFVFVCGDETPRPLIEEGEYETQVIKMEILYIRTIMELFGRIKQSYAATIRTSVDSNTRNCKSVIYNETGEADKAISRPHSCKVNFRDAWSCYLCLIIPLHDEAILPQVKKYVCEL